MFDIAIDPMNEVKKKQYRNVIFIIIGILMLATITIFVIAHASQQKSDEKPLAALTSPVDTFPAQTVWMERAQNELKKQESVQASLKAEMDAIKNSTNEQSHLADEKYAALQKENAQLAESLKSQTVMGNTNTQDSDHENVDADFSHHLNRENVDAENLHDMALTGIDEDTLHLSVKVTAKIPDNNPDTFVPAGTFVEAIMLGAADASAGVEAQANPTPMLFRIVANGTLPNHRQSHLKDCVATAAVVGDISSERGLIRLERLSCTFPSGEIVEQPVQATVFGLDAKNGVRGTPVWREGALLGRAAVAGTLSGLGSAVSQTYTTNSISPLGTTQTVDSNDIFKYGAAQGVSNAMEKLADYNIRRAEQYHPVIQLSAGQAVDIVFTKGFYLDGAPHSVTKTVKSSEESENALFATTAKTGDAQGLTLTASQVEKIKENEESLS